MKKRVLLALLPAAMILAACAGAGQKANDKNVLFNEDTLAHEELFEQKGFGKIHKLSHLDSSLPAIGVQRSDVKEITVSGTPTNVVSIRFVAAVNLDSEHLADAHPVWTRVLYEEDGDGVLKGVDTLESTKAYTKINDGGSGTLPSAFGEYNYFVTYTMTNIPVAYNNCYFNVSLSLGGVSSRVLATTVDLSSHFSFNSTSNNFFLTGTFSGAPGDIAQDGTTHENWEGQNAASFTTPYLNAGDSFMVVQRTATIFKMWSNMNDGDANLNDNDAGRIIVGQPHKYRLYLNTSDQLYHTTYNEGTVYYVRGPATSGDWSNLTNDNFRLVNDPDNLGFIRVNLGEGAFKLTHKEDWNNAIGYWDCDDGGAKDDTITYDGDGNFVCSEAGLYDIYWKTGNRAYIEKVVAA